ncbi:MAG: hypothetical protein ACLS4Z_10865 [Christensenellaceae bacterium]
MLEKKHANPVLKMGLMNVRSPVRILRPRCPRAARVLAVVAVFGLLSLLARPKERRKPSSATRGRRGVSTTRITTRTKCPAV